MLPKFWYHQTISIRLSAASTSSKFDFKSFQNPSCLSRRSFRTGTSVAVVLFADEGTVSMTSDVLGNGITLKARIEKGKAMVT